MNENEQSLKQRKIALAQSEHAAIVVELLRDCVTKTPLIADTEWKTIVNTITLEAESNMMRNVVDLIEKIKSGGLHDQ